MVLIQKDLLKDPYVHHEKIDLEQLELELVDLQILVEEVTDHIVKESNGKDSTSINQTCT